MWHIPTLADVMAAQERIRPYLAATPLHRYSGLDALIGAEVYIKHENYHPVGAFKVRGGINLAAQLPPQERGRGMIGASTGNHGQSIAFAGQTFGIPVKIVVPEGANPGKVSAMQGMGAEVIFYGEKFDDARLHSVTLAEQFGYRYVHSVNEPDLIAGVGTATLEMLQKQPDIEVIFVPIGAGSGACGASIVAHGINPAIQVIGVQSERAPAAYYSWKNRALESHPNQTIAEGLATGVGFELTQQIMWEHLADFMLVSDEAIMQAVVWYLEEARTLAEGAGASSLAAAYARRDKLGGKKVGIILSGGNLALGQLKQILAA